MADKYYRVKEDNFLWQKDAILKRQGRGTDGGYLPVEDLWNNTPVNDEEYISAKIIEHPNNEKYFERVYPDTITGKLFKTAEQMRDAFSGAFKG